MQNVFLLKGNWFKYYLAATLIQRVCVSASFKKQNDKLRIMCTETAVVSERTCWIHLSRPWKAQVSQLPSELIWRRGWRRTTCRSDTPARCGSRSWWACGCTRTAGARGPPPAPACWGRRSEPWRAPAGSQTAWLPPAGRRRLTGRRTKTLSTEEVWKCSERSSGFVLSFCSGSLGDVLGPRLTCTLKLTWFAGVVDPLQQRQALLLGPVVNDSGQNVEIGRRDFTGEEISWTHDRS